MLHSAKKLSVAQYISANLVGISSPNVSGEDILVRLQKQQEIPAKESNKALYASIFFSILFFFKFFNVNFEIIVFGQKPLQIPNGLFLFALLSLGSIAFAAIRVVDSLIYKRIMRGVCEKFWPNNADLIYRSYVGGDEIANIAINLTGKGINFTKLQMFQNINLTFGSIVITIVAALPFITAIMFLIQHEYSLIGSSIFQSLVMIVGLAASISISINAILIGHSAEYSDL